MAKKFKKGEEVILINKSISGPFFIEASAKIIKKLNYADNYYQVLIDGRGKENRFIDPESQLDAFDYCAKLNKQLQQLK